MGGFGVQIPSLGIVKIVRDWSCIVLTGWQVFKVVALFVRCLLRLTTTTMKPTGALSSDMPGRESQLSIPSTHY
jgi:hypothetical protein